MLEPSVQLTNPIDVALASGGYDTAVLEPNRVRWFNFSGSGMAENPALAVTGLTNPVAFAVADPNTGWDVAVVDGTQVKHYSFTGSGMAYNVERFGGAAEFRLLDVPLRHRMAGHGERAAEIAGRGDEQPHVPGGQRREPLGRGVLDGPLPGRVSHGNGGSDATLRERGGRYGAIERPALRGRRGGDGRERVRGLVRGASGEGHELG